MYVLCSVHVPTCICKVFNETKKYLLFVYIHVVESALMHFFVSEWSKMHTIFTRDNGKESKLFLAIWRGKTPLVPYSPPPSLSLYLEVTQCAIHTVVQIVWATVQLTVPMSLIDICPVKSAHCGCTQACVCLCIAVCVFFAVIEDP